MTLAAILALASAAVSCDPVKHTVTLEVVSPDPGLDAPIEFLLVAKGSDHDYESMFVAEAEASEIAAAFEKAGFGKGAPADDCQCRFVPTGDQLEIEPAITNFVRDVRGETWCRAVHTGGSRNADGSAVMATNMPLAVFALYNLPQSLIQFEDALIQGDVYGRFLPAVKLPKGEKRKITFKLVPNSRMESVTADFNSTNAVTVIARMQQKAAARPIAVVPGFDGDMDVKTAAGVCTALAALDGAGKIRINGFKPGEFYFRAFLPLESWRDRHERLSQPVELRLGKTAAEDKIVLIDEDWSEQNTKEAKLTVREYIFAEGVKRIPDNQINCLIFATPETKLSRLYELKRTLPGQLTNFYVYP